MRTWCYGYIFLVQNIHIYINAVVQSYKYNLVISPLSYIFPSFRCHVRNKREIFLYAFILIRIIWTQNRTDVLSVARIYFQNTSALSAFQPFILLFGEDVSSVVTDVSPSFCARGATLFSYDRWYITHASVVCTRCHCSILAI